MFSMGLKEMRNKIYLSIILLTPPAVLLLSWLYFTQIFDPDGSYDGKRMEFSSRAILILINLKIVRAMMTYWSLKMVNGYCQFM